MFYFKFNAYLKLIQKTEYANMSARKKSSLFVSFFFLSLCKEIKHKILCSVRIFKIVSLSEFDQIYSLNLRRYSCRIAALEYPKQKNLQKIKHYENFRKKGI
ncbi:MAG: hypothetical protein EAZ08_07650 [Cytophagales bacterium]|nr:MAG: hypothetical protein EAZ08_07650 [Cytophagales bacterium]